MKQDHSKQKTIVCPHHILLGCMPSPCTPAGLTSCSCSRWWRWTDEAPAAHQEQENHLKMQQKQPFRVQRYREGNRWLSPCCHFKKKKKFRQNCWLHVTEKQNLYSDFQTCYFLFWLYKNSFVKQEIHLNSVFICTLFLFPLFLRVRVCYCFNGRREHFFKKISLKRKWKLKRHQMNV